MMKIERLSSQDIEIGVNNSGIIVLKNIDDYPDGNLFIGEVGDQVPFEIERIYCITELYRPHAIRGQHAHIELSQIIFCLTGSFDLILDDGDTKQTVLMDTAGKGVVLGPLLWHEMTNFSPDCTILVLASDKYSEADYIRDYETFLKFLQQAS